ncbi:hypothetical protein [Lolliginicoccus suaedae]|uniref:hypothetical protein n=1 Tax=Lolliginicoccus suaedae TaxID=2605429 RepID=UPI0011EC9EF2|nr:hypothetical protein [Lolliginicoccus suaedae]
MTAQENLGIVVSTDGVHSALVGVDEETEYRHRALSRDNAHDLGDIVSSLIGIMRIRAATRNATVGRVIIACMTSGQEQTINTVLSAHGVTAFQFVRVDEAMWAYARMHTDVRGAPRALMIMATDDGCATALYDGFTGKRVTMSLDSQLTTTAIDEHVREILLEKAPYLRISTARAAQLRAELDDQDIAEHTQGDTTISVSRAELDQLIDDQITIALTRIDALLEKSGSTPDVVCLFGTGVFFDPMAERAREHFSGDVVVPHDHRTAAALGALHFLSPWTPPRPPAPPAPPTPPAAPPVAALATTRADGAASESPAPPREQEHPGPPAPGPAAPPQQQARADAPALGTGPDSRLVLPGRAPATSTHPLAAGKEIVEIRTASKSRRKRRRARHRAQSTFSPAAVAGTIVLGLVLGAVIFLLWTLLFI